MKKKKIDPKEWAEDFEVFVNSPEVSPPTHVREEIFRVVHRDLNPRLWMVMVKLAGIHVFVGSVSLLLCSQFGMGRGPSLMPAFMDYGIFACMTFCGALFLGFTTSVAAFVLSNAELAKVRKTCYAPVGLLGLASLGVFFCFGAEIALNLSLMWLFGAVVSGSAFLEIGSGIRHYRLRIQAAR